MRIPFTKKNQQEEVKNVNKEERMTKLEEANQANRELAREHEERLGKLEKSREEQQKAIASLNDGSRENSEDEASLAEEKAKTEDEANLAEEISRLREELAIRDKEIAKLSDSRVMAERAMVYLRELPAEEKVRIARELGLNVAEATKEDKAQVAEDVGDPDIVASLEDVANPDAYLKSDEMGVYIKVGK